MKVSVDLGRCQGHGSCNLQCPEVFGFDDQGMAKVLVDAVPAAHEGAVVRAEGACPERAIVIERA